MKCKDCKHYDNISGSTCYNQKIHKLLKSVPAWVPGDFGCEYGEPCPPKALTLEERIKATENQIDRWLNNPARALDMHRVEKIEETIDSLLAVGTTTDQLKAIEKWQEYRKAQNG